MYNIHCKCIWMREEWTTIDVTFSLLLMSCDHLPDPAGGSQHVSIPRPQFSRAQPHHPSPIRASLPIPCHCNNCVCLWMSAPCCCSLGPGNAMGSVSPGQCCLLCWGMVHIVLCSTHCTQHGAGDYIQKATRDE